MNACLLVCLFILLLLLFSSRNKDSLLPLTRRMSGDSDSSTASSKGAGGAPSGSRLSHASRRSNTDEVVLLVNRTAGKHAIERPAGGETLRSPQPRARSASRERLTPVLSSPNKIKPSPSRGGTSQHDRGRTLGPEGPRRFQVSRSLSQGKTPPRRLSDATPGSPRHADSKPGSPRSNGSFPKRPAPLSASSSPLKTGSGSPSKKGVVTPRPPAPGSPCVGNRRLLPPIARATPRSPAYNQHTIQSPRQAGNAPRQFGHQNPFQKDDLGSGFGCLGFPLDPKREQELYRSFEAEFLANTQPGKLPPALPVSQASGDPNVTDSAYSSSNSSSSSVYVCGKSGPLPDLRQAKRTSGAQNCALEDPPTLLHNRTRVSLPNGLRKLPAISSSMENYINGGHTGGHTTGFTNSFAPTEQHEDPDPDCGRTRDTAYDPETNGNTESPPPYPSYPFPSPPPPDDCSYTDSSSESSSICLSLTEPLLAGSHTPPPSLGDGNADRRDTVLLRAKRGQKKAERVPSIYKLKLRPRVRPRTDNRPENGPSRIPTPLSYRETTGSGNLTPPLTQRSRKHPHQAFSDVIRQQRRSASVGSRQRSYSPESNIHPDAWM